MSLIEDFKSKELYILFKLQIYYKFKIFNTIFYLNSTNIFINY